MFINYIFLKMKYSKNMHVYKISELNILIESTLRIQFPTSIHVEGEISNFSASGNGHWYFTLKDNKNQISAVMFRNANTYVQSIPKDGDMVTIIGELSFYKIRGQCQIVCSLLTLQGTGEILARIQARKEKLQKEGVFDQDKKKPLPVFPQKIAIITSRNAAAFEDIKKTFLQNGIFAHLFLLHCSVQGDNAAEEIIKQISYVNMHLTLFDVIILTRGGGSLEDLLPFSDEKLVRVVAHSTVPIVCGVGHETDSPLCEFAADICSHTPTKAAEIICRQSIDFQMQIARIKETMLKDYKNTISNALYLTSQFNPTALIPSFLRRTNNLRQLIDTNAKRLEQKIKEYKNHTHTIIKSMTEVLQKSSPLTILSRGYTLIFDKEKKTLYKCSSNLKKDDTITILFKDGNKSAIIK